WGGSGLTGISLTASTAARPALGPRRIDPRPFLADEVLRLAYGREHLKDTPRIAEPGLADFPRDPRPGAAHKGHSVAPWQAQCPRGQASKILVDRLVAGGHGACLHPPIIPFPPGFVEPGTPAAPPARSAGAARGRRASRQWRGAAPRGPRGRPQPLHSAPFV